MGGISVMLLMGMLSAMYVFFIAVIAVLIIYFAVSYVFESIAAMGMCKNLYYKHSGTAWIPFYNKYLLGKIAGNKALGIIEGVLNLSIATVAVLFFCFELEIGIIGLIALLACVIASFVINVIIADKIFKNLNIRYSDVLTVVNVLTFGLSRPIILFIVKNANSKNMIHIHF